MAAERRFGEIDTVLRQINVTMTSTIDRMDRMESAMTALSADITAHKGLIDSEKKALIEQVNKEFDAHKKAITQVINDARGEFANVKDNLGELYGATGQAFADIKGKVDNLEHEFRQRHRGSGGTSKSGKEKGYLPIKSLVPAVFGEDEGQWRKWQEDVSDYLDTLQPGMRDWLKVVEKATDIVDDEWVTKNRAGHPADVVDDATALFIALKALTTGEARMVVQGVRDHNGFAAWKHLHQRFGLSVAAKQGKAMCDVSMMVQRPAETPAETRTLVTEFERRVRYAEEATGQSLGDGHAKSRAARRPEPKRRPTKII